MKVVQAEDTDTIIEETQVGCPCFIIERIVMWFIVAAIVLVSIAISWEFRTTMHLQNEFLRSEMIKENILDRQHVLYKHDPPVWMP